MFYKDLTSLEGHAIAAMVEYSFKPIEYKYENLTTEEKETYTFQEFQALINIKEKVLGR